MDASLQDRAEQLAGEFASQAKTAEELNDLMRLMMKSAMERMLDTEMDVHLGRKSGDATSDGPASGGRRVSTSSEEVGQSRSQSSQWAFSKKTVRGDDLGEVHD